MCNVIHTASPYQVHTPGKHMQTTMHIRGPLAVICFALIQYYTVTM